MITPGEIPKEVPILNEDYTDYLEWTPEEEEAFIDILSKRDHLNDFDLDA